MSIFAPRAVARLQSGWRRTRARAAPRRRSSRIPCPSARSTSSASTRTSASDCASPLGPVPKIFPARPLALPALPRPRLPDPHLFPSDPPSTFPSQRTPPDRRVQPSGGDPPRVRDRPHPRARPRARRGRRRHPRAPHRVPRRERVGPDPPRRDERRRGRGYVPRAQRPRREGGDGGDDARGDARRVTVRREDVRRGVESARGRLRRQGGDGARGWKSRMKARRVGSRR